MKGTPGDWTIYGGQDSGWYAYNLRDGRRHELGRGAFASAAARFVREIGPYYESREQQPPVPYVDYDDD